ncbi:MAG TPA: GAF domain-containing protein [Steroidobacteraceae bacterium]|nr:GAF domain-containing protein [Steroidobacteraceae bacterium]
MSAQPKTVAARAQRQAETLRRVVEEISSELELRPLLTRIVSHACELLDAEDGSIGLYDAQKHLIRTEATFRMPAGEEGAEMGPGVGLAGAVLASGAPVVIDSYGSLANITLPELKDNPVIGVPIHGHGRLLGFFGIGARPPRRFDSADLETLQLFARHAAIAIENALRYRAEQRRSERMELIARVSRLISSGLEPDDLVHTAAEVIHEVLGYPNVVIPLVEKGEPDYLLFHAHAGAYRNVFREPYTMPITRGICGVAVRERRAQIVNDVHNDPYYVAPPLPIEVTSELAVPIVLGNEAFGVINIESTQPFHSDDEASIQIIADHLAVAIKNARLYAEARQAAVMRERQRLARDLHDSVSQVLSSISLIAQSLAPAWKRDPLEGERRARRLEELSRHGFAEMRALLRELRPADLGVSQPGEAAGIDEVRRVGLATALRRLATLLAPETPEIRIDLTHYTPQALASEETLFRMCQEALSNAIRHSGARLVTVHSRLEDTYLTLVVEDNGCGFSFADEQLTRTERDGGLGLHTLRERAISLGGAVSYQSTLGHGTRVTFTIPRRDRTPT